MDFFKPACQSGPFNEATFGLCDDQHARCAYVDTTTPGNWTATVDNPAQRAITFTAVDKCVIQDGEETDRPRCDGMLTAENLLYLVELKDQRADWQSQAKAQLISTIQFLHQYHSEDLRRFRHKKAFACNKRGGGFRVVSQEEQRRFFHQYGFRLDVQSTVLVPAGVGG